MIRWTTEQELAIKTRGGNLLVSAAAGTGKTAVLVERAIRLITEDGVDSDRLLVVTFTNAAAAEMKDRLRQALMDQIRKNPRAARLRSQLTLLNRACIGTIHSFCLNIIKQHFHLVGLDPRVRVAQEEEAALLRAEACEELFERRYDGARQDFLSLLDCLGGERGWSSLQELVLSLYKYAQNSPAPRRWLRTIADSFFLPANVRLESLPWFCDLKKYILWELKAAQAMIMEALALASLPKGPADYREALENDLVLIEKLSRSCSGTWEDITRALAGAEFAKLNCLRRSPDKDRQEQVKNSREAAKRKVSALRGLVLSRSAGEILRELAQIAPLMRELSGLVLEFEDLYRQAKRSHGVVDFPDLEHFALKILTHPADQEEKLIPSDAARQMQSQFAEVLVDEYQDINPVQEAILSLVTRNNLFMVGDAKQSIYRFRLTEPGIFLAKYKAYAEISTDSPQRKINLTRNYRSRKNLLDAVNCLFRGLMTGETAEIDYDELVYGANYPPPDAGDPAELHLLPAPPKTACAPVLSREEGASEPSGAEPPEEVEEVEEMETARREALFVARQIAGLVRGQPPYRVWDKEKGALRPLSYRDVAVLLRSTIDAAPVFLEEFARLDIPAYADTSAGYFQAAEIETMISLLQVIDNPRQDIPLAGVLRSPVVGLSMEEMARVRLFCPDGDFYDALAVAARRGAAPGDRDGEDPPQQAADKTTTAQDGGGLSAKLSAFLAQLERWRTISRRRPLSLLIWDIYSQTGYYDFVGGLPGGRQRQANLRALVNRARQYENTSFRGLSGFLNFLARLKESGHDLGTAGALGENENVVRIMSIHKSKGLEFPVVFVAGLGRQFNLQDLNKNILIHKELGLGPQFIDFQTRVSYPTLPKIAVRTRLKLESLAEEMRILYVACTRAREKLVLVGTVHELPEALEKWRRAALITEPGASLAASRTYLDWICPALLRKESAERAGEKISANTPKNISIDHLWQIRLWEEGELSRLFVLPQPTRNQALLKKVKRLESVESGQEYAGLIARRLNWRYPHAGVDRPAKLAASEAKRFFAPLQEEEEPSPIIPGAPEPADLFLSRPKFLQTHKRLSPAERGLAFHRVMQTLNFQKCRTEEEIREHIRAMQENELLTAEQAAAVDVGAIAHFLQTPLGRRCLRARSVQREVPFVLALLAQEIYPELSGTGEKVLAQGMIDLLLEEEDGLVIIDFKTDQVSPGDARGLEQQKEKYRGQIALYVRAVQAILKKPVKEAYLYFSAAGKEKLVFPERGLSGARKLSGGAPQAVKKSPDIFA